MHTGCLKGLVQGAVQSAVIADCFAGGLHFWGEVGIQVADLIEGEHGDLDIEALLLVGVNIEDALFLQALAQDDFGGDVCLCQYIAPIKTEYRKRNALL